ncbi:MmcQ/YjbR family DNA-binding protein [Candidatus Kapabacteria bacterium]|nr:MmcQ/YjbR family DNA-binding protein [Candidatus Kapabacteria bacterium]
MNLEEIRNYCLNKRGATESTPFGDDTLVFKVANKMFLLMGLTSSETRFNVKCNPEIAIDLRERFDSVIPGYHMNKKHWNTIISSSELSDEFIKEQIDNSYSLIVLSLPKKIQTDLL